MYFPDVALQAKVNELQGELQWHQQKGAGSHRGQNRGVRVDDQGLKKTQHPKNENVSQIEHKRPGQSLETRRTLGDENSCRNVRSAALHVASGKLSTAKAIQMAIACRSR